MKLLSPATPRPLACRPLSHTKAALGLLLCTLLAPSALPPYAQAQAPATTPAPVRQVGTVRAVSAQSLTLATDAGSAVTFTLAGTVRVLQLPPGSTDIKAAQPATLSDIAEGDRVLIVGHPAEGTAAVATRIVLMKSAAIAQNNATRQADWQRRGSGGIVTAVDPAAKTVSIISGSRKITIDTSPSTVFRRYASGSVKFEEARPGTLAELQPGDQLRVRGNKSPGSTPGSTPDSTTVQAEEIVSGSFRNLSGTIASIDTAASTLTLKDLATKKTVTVAITPESDLRNLPPEMAARFAARSGSGPSPGSRPTAESASATPDSAASAAAASTSGPHRNPPATGSPASQTPTAPPPVDSTSGIATSGAGASPGNTQTPGAGRSAGDLAQMITRLPKFTLAGLKSGEAVMIVASASTGNTGPVTAITVLSGVEPLLAAKDASSFNISPWSLGAGGDAAEGATQ